MDPPSSFNKSRINPLKPTRKITKPRRYSTSDGDGTFCLFKNKSLTVGKKRGMPIVSNFTSLKESRDETKASQPTFDVAVDMIDGFPIWSLESCQELERFSRFTEELVVESSRQEVATINSPTPATEAEDINLDKVPAASSPKQSKIVDLSSFPLLTSHHTQEKALVASYSQLSKFTQVCEKSSQTENRFNPHWRRLLKKQRILELTARNSYRALRKRLLRCLQELRRKDVELTLLKKQQNRLNSIKYDISSQLENWIVDSQKNIFQPYSCESCKKVFLLKSSLDSHWCLNRKTVSTKLLSCEFCSISLYRSDTMRMHVRHTHGTHLDPAQAFELFDETI